MISFSSFVDLLNETDTTQMSGFHKEMASLLDHVTELMNWEMLIECYFENTGHSVLLPWYFVPELVAHRVVTTNYEIPCIAED